MPSEGSPPGPAPPDVPGYSLSEPIHHSARSLVYRATAAGGGQVVVKLHRSTYPTERELAATRLAFEIGRSLDGAPGVVPHLDLVPAGHDLALVTADVGGTSLDRVLADSGPPGLAAALRIGAEVAEALAAVHDADVVHHDVKPANVLVGPGLAGAVLIDFGHASRLRSEHVEAVAAAGTLQYISPEQTGRMNRPVDARSDLYGLGVTLFELLTGRLPFPDTDPLALVHAHIARPPPQVADLVPDVPALVGDIVAKLLRKNAEDRYLGARGLAHDLRAALAAVATGDEPAFELGQGDVPTKLTIPETLYGREDELARLGAAFDRAAAGGREALFVAGYSGIGKSRLVGEVQPRIVERAGSFAAGKFDLFRREVPYLGWVGALRDVVRQALLLPEAELAARRADLAERLAGNGAALVEVAPEVELLLGPQPPLPAVAPAEAHARFNRAFRAFIAGLARPEHPLVLFIDDLQWADLASLDMLEVLLTDRAAAHLLVLGAWRDNEVGPDHPLRATLRRLAEAGVAYERLDLGPLAGHHVTELVAATVFAARPEADPLGRLVDRKTAGNPFFVHQFVEALYRDGLLGFDAQAAAWSWDLATIEAQSITDNVAELMAGRIASLPADTRVALEAASCVGATFDLDTLAALAPGSRADTARALDVALTEGLIVPLDATYRFATGHAAAAEAHGEASALNPRYGFLHDRVQEAAHASVDPVQRAALQLRIGRLLLDGASDTELDDRAVDVAAHLSEAIELLDDPAERLRFAEVFLRAGRRAKGAMAVDAAVAYLGHAADLLPADAWAAHRDLALAVHTEAADAAYVAGRFDEIDRHAGPVLDHAASALERVPIHNIRIGVGVAQARYADATRYAVEVLAEDFGIELPQAPTKAHVVAGLVSLRLALRGTSPADLLALPEMRDPATRAAMDILMKSATNAYWAVPNLVPLIAFTMCRLSLEHGNIGLSAYGYALYGMISAAAVGDVPTGYAYGGMAMDLLAATGDRHLVGKTALLWHGFIRHARDPMRECAADVLDAYHAAMDAGDVENAVYCGTVAFYTDLLAGRPLDRLEERYGGYVAAMLESGQEQTIYALRTWLQVVANLRDGDRVQPELTGEHIDFETVLAGLLADENGNAIPQGASAAGFLAFLLGDLERAERHLGLLWEYRESAPGQTFLGPCHALYAVTLLRKARPTRRDRVRLARVRMELRTRARRNPHDFEPFLALVRAEAARSAGRGATAMAAYLDAAALAETRGFRYVEGLALEGAAELHRGRGHRAVAEQLTRRAAAVWRRFGAAARLRMLGDVGAEVDVSQTSADGLADLDVRTLLDTVHAVSSEIRLDRLTARVLELALRNAGARRGLLAVADAGPPAPVATATMDDDGAVSVQGGAPAEADVPRGVLDFVARTREPVVVDDAATDPVLGRDPYVAARRTRSVLCVPLLRSGELVGLLYLENDLGVGAFTAHHAAVIETIGGQAAVSLENARLFEQQRAQAEAFARFVPRPFLERLDRSRIVDVQLGDAVVADLTVLFSDLRGFTTISERMSVEDNFRLLNDYLARMGPIVHAHGGFIDKYVGDSVMALFTGGTGEAVAAAVGMHRALAEFNAAGHGWPPLAMGIGIHAGSVMLGTIGSAERMDTTVIGDTVNAAARLEGMTKPYGAPLLVSTEVLDRLGDGASFATREAGRVQVKGKDVPITVHEILDARPADEAAALAATGAAFAAAVAAWYAASFEEARELFADCLAAAPFDALAERYVARCAELAAAGVAGEWEGVDVLTEK